MNLRRKIQQLLKEAIETLHVQDQFQDRFLSRRTMTVGLEIGMGNYEEVGLYKINDNIITELKNRFKILSQRNFQKKQSYAIKIMDIIINPDEIEYFNPENKHLYKNRQKYKAPFVLLNDSSHDSNGNVIYAIVRHGEIITIMLAKNYIKITPQKMNVDVVIKNWDLIVHRKYR